MNECSFSSLTPLESGDEGDAVSHLGALFPEACEKHARILGAALDLFVEQGFRGTTIPAIAGRAGVAAGTIYLYFESKERLVNTLLGGLKGQLAARLLTDLAAAGDDVAAQFTALWGVFAEFALRHPRAVAFLDLHHHGSYITPEALAAWQPGEAALEAHFALGVRRGDYVDMTPAALRAVVVGTLIGAHKLSRGGHLEITPALLDQLGACARRAIARPSPIPTREERSPS